MVSKDITVESIEEVSKILRRAPVIWDNIHANDYDQKRLFLGPYKGRSTELIPRLKGVLTNPNCEFESNFVAIHTLATWYKSNMNGVRKDVVMSKYDLHVYSFVLFWCGHTAQQVINPRVCFSILPFTSGWRGQHSVHPDQVREWGQWWRAGDGHALQSTARFKAGSHRMAGRILRSSSIQQ